MLHERCAVLFSEKTITNEKLARKVDQIEKHASDHDEVLTDLIHEIRKPIETAKQKTQEKRSVL